MEGCVNRWKGGSWIRPYVVTACIALLAMTLVGCRVDPRKDALAYETRVQAEIQARDAALAREIRAAEAVDAQALRDWKATVREATTQTVQERANTFVSILGLVLTAAGSVVVLGVAWAATQTVQGMGKALVQFAVMRSGLIHMDRSTRTFPMLRHAHGTRYALAVPNTGSVLMLDEKHEADRQLIAAFAQVSTTGAAYQEMKGGGQGQAQPVLVMEGEA